MNIDNLPRAQNRYLINIKYINEPRNKSGGVSIPLSLTSGEEFHM